MRELAKLPSTLVLRCSSTSESKMLSGESCPVDMLAIARWAAQAGMRPGVRSGGSSGPVRLRSKRQEPFLTVVELLAWFLV